MLRRDLLIIVAASALVLAIISCDQTPEPTPTPIPTPISISDMTEEKIVIYNFITLGSFVLMGVVTGAVAKSRGQKAIAWGLFGSVFFPFAVPIWSCYSSS